MSKEHNGVSYMLIVKDQTTHFWHLLKKFLLTHNSEQLCGSYISSNWYQEKVANESEPIEYFLIEVDSSAAISDIINSLMIDINHTKYKIYDLLVRYQNWLRNLWHFTIPENSYNTESIELTPKESNERNITLIFSIREHITYNDVTEKYVSTPQMVIDL